jgi:hypothetical protein
VRAVAQAYIYIYIYIYVYVYTIAAEVGGRDRGKYMQSFKLNLVNEATESGRRSGESVASVLRSTRTSGKALRIYSDPSLNYS